jgi:hypothetical protein
MLPEETKKRVTMTYGDYDTGFLPGNICAIFDWGDRNFKPERHLEDVVKFARNSLRATKDEKAKEVLKKLIVDAKKGLKKLDQPLPKLRR